MSSNSVQDRLTAALAISTVAAVVACTLAAIFPSTAFALERVGGCENGWQFYNDGNAYQCNPASNSNGDPTTKATKIRVNSRPGGERKVGSAAPKEVKIPHPDVYSLYTLEERIRLSATPPSGFTSTFSTLPEILRSATIIYKSEYQASIPRDRFTAAKLRVLNAWYRDIFVAGGEVRPGRAIASSVFCSHSIHAAATSQVTVACNVQPIESAPICVVSAARC